MADQDLLTVEDRVKLLVNALAEEKDHEPVVKLFTPDAPATWLLTEIDPDDEDRGHGLCDLGQGFPELGWVSLAELEALRRPLGLPIERDLYFRARKSIGAYAREARLAGRIAV